MLLPKYSVIDVCNALQSVNSKGSIKQGADRRNNSALMLAANKLSNWLFEIQPNIGFLDRQTAQIAGNILNAELNGDNCLSCEIALNYKRFSITQSSPQSKNIVIRDLDTLEEMTVEDIAFPNLQKRMLALYSQEQLDQGNSLIDLSPFKLTNPNFQSLLASYLDDWANPNVEPLLASYLASKPFSGSDLYKPALLRQYQERERMQGKANMLNQYLDKARKAKELSIDLNKFAFSDAVSATLDLLGKDILDEIICGDGLYNTKYRLTNLNATGGGQLIDKPMAIELLGHYHDRERKANALSDALSIDLSEFDLSDVNVKAVDFKNTKLSQDNLDAIIAGGGNLSSAKLGKDLEAIVHYLDDIKIDKPVAIQLIEAGANPRVVLLKYLATERDKTENRARQAGNDFTAPDNHAKSDGINIGGIDLDRVDLRGIDTRDVSTAGIPSVHLFGRAYRVEDKKVQSNLDRDFLAMLTVYSKSVASVLLKSSSLDDANGVPIEKIKMVNSVLELARKHATSSQSLIANTIYLSAGNCTETALLCKSMIDLYMIKSLNELGYGDVSIKASVAASNDKLSDHCVVFVEYLFQEESKRYIVDPWSGGMAWAHEDAMDHFHKSRPNNYVHEKTEFDVYHPLNSSIEGKQFESAIQPIFDQFNVNEQLELTIKKHKADFIGFPA